MDYGAEIINISKIKDSFFIGDKIAGTNLDVLIQFKISHIINAAGNQIMNQFESIGIQYYTLYWLENPNQNLFDSNDEIVDKILLFIRDSYIRGEGLLIHSVKGKNRCCIVVIIYLMKKYYWSVNKCIDFLKSKKEDIEIEPYFIQQLISYEIRLSKITNIKTTNWNEITFKDNDEKLLRNTYVNGLPVKQLNSFNIEEINNIIKEDKKNLIKKNNTHINWADEDKLINYNFEKELLFQNEIKPINCHITTKPIKSSIKKNKDILSLSQSISINNKNNINNGTNNLNISGNQNKKKLKIRADVDIDKISSEYNTISPNIIKQLIENDSFYFLGMVKNNVNNINSLNNEKSFKGHNSKKKRPLSYDNKSKKNNNNKKNILKDNKNMNNEQINIKSYSLNKNGNIYKKGINSYNDNINSYFINDQNKIKKLLENNRGNKLLISLNNQNKMNNLINNFTYLNNNYINGNSQFKKLYNNNYPNKNLINNENNSNSLSISLKRQNQDSNNIKKKSKLNIFNYYFLLNRCRFFWFCK
jgi:protein-tyrosine phosphatase